MDFEPYRNSEDHSLNLVLMYRDTYGYNNHEVAEEYLREVMEMRPIVSRQMAAIALVTAHSLQSMHLE